MHVDTQALAHSPMLRAYFSPMITHIALCYTLMLKWTPSEGAEVWISYKSCPFFPITFLSSDLHYVITSWTVIF